MPLPLVISIPHGAGAVPPEIMNDLSLSPEQVLEAVDSGTQDVFGDLPVLACIKAEWARFVVDLNRAPDQMGPKGVIARLDYHRRPIFQAGKEPDRSETEKRIDTFYRPFHSRLRQALQNPALKLLLDCHSLNGVGPREAPDHGNHRADIILGNNGGAGGRVVPRRGRITCPVAVLEAMQAAFRRVGFSVAINQPYPGGYITRHYGQELAARGKAAVQIELNKAIFMERGKPGVILEKAVQVKSRILEALQEIVQALD